MKEIEISCPIGKEPSPEQIISAASRALGVSPKAVAHYRISRRSVDARGEILYRYRVEAYKTGEEYQEYRLPEYRDVSSARPVIVIGAGPAGMFAALRLLMRGWTLIPTTVSGREAQALSLTASSSPALQKEGTSAKCFISSWHSGLTRRFS